MIQQVSRNLCESHDHGFKFILESCIYDNCKDVSTRVINNEKIRDAIIAYMKVKKITCLLKLGTIRENKLTISCYGTCKYNKEHDKKFLFKFIKNGGETESYKMLVTSTGTNIDKHVSSPKFLQVRGNKRVLAQKELQGKSVKMYLLEKKMNTDCDLAIAGNTQELMNENTAYKMKSEYKSAADLIKNCDLFDLLAEADKNSDNYIQKVNKFFLFVCFFINLFYKGRHSNGGISLHRTTTAATFQTSRLIF